jgi:hypothetical protein
MLSMSIIEKRFSAATLVFAKILLLAFVSAAQEIEAIVKILPADSVRIEGKVSDKNSNQSYRNWSFTNSIAGIENLGARISEFNLSGEQNRPVLFKKLTDGEYLANEEASVFDYRVDLKPLSNAAAKRTFRGFRAKAVF